MKVLFIRLDHIGDCFLTLPAIKEFRENLPDAQISVLCKENTRDIFNYSELIDNIYTLNPLHAINHYEKRSGVFYFLKTLYDLNKEGFNRIYNFREHVFERAMMTLVRGRYQCSIKHLMYHYDVHIMKRNRVMLGHAFDYRVNGESDYVRLNTNLLDQKTKDELIKEAQGKLLFHIGGSYMKKLPMKRLNELIILLKKDIKDLVIVRSSFDNLVFEDEGSMKIDSVLQWAYLAEIARGCICFDSGPMHIAAAHARKLFAIFGPTSVAYFGPKADRQKIFRPKEYKEDFIPGMRFSFERFGRYLQDIDLNILLDEIREYF